jgi:hypothetical protein
MHRRFLEKLLIEKKNKTPAILAGVFFYIGEKEKCGLFYCFADLLKRKRKEKRNKSAPLQG